MITLLVIKRRELVPPPTGSHNVSWSIRFQQASLYHCCTLVLREIKPGCVNNQRTSDPEPYLRGWTPLSTPAYWRSETVPPQNGSPHQRKDTWVEREINKKRAREVRQWCTESLSTGKCTFSKVVLSKHRYSICPSSINLNNSILDTFSLCKM